VNVEKIYQLRIQLQDGAGGVALGSRACRYDFGDGWEHDVFIEEKEPARSPTTSVRCLVWLAPTPVRRMTSVDSPATRIS
jgi:hypothetical protein